MAYQIIWSQEAFKAIDHVVDYLQIHWHDSDITHFLERVNTTLSLLENNPTIFRHSAKQNVYEVLITKHNLLIYEIDESRKIVYLLAVFDTRSNPKKKQKLFKKKR